MQKFYKSPLPSGDFLFLEKEKHALYKIYNVAYNIIVNRIFNIHDLNIHHLTAEACYCGHED